MLSLKEASAHFMLPTMTPSVKVQKCSWLHSSTPSTVDACDAHMPQQRRTDIQHWAHGQVKVGCLVNFLRADEADRANKDENMYVWTHQNTRR